MKKILLFSAIIYLLAGCTELGEPPMHPSGWTDSQSDDSHMAKIAITGIEGCKDCHGGIEKHDYYGGTSGVSCYQCHAGGPTGHPAYSIWISEPTNPKFHGNDNIERCKLCHGDNWKGGISDISCYTCHETL